MKKPAPSHCILTDRSLLALSGADTAELLQGTLTQDIKQLDTQPLIYATHLSPQGKLLADLFVFRQADHFYLDVSTSQLMPLAKSLHHYCVGLTADFENVSAEWSITADLAATTGWPDPRLTALGHRNYTPTPPEKGDDCNAYTAHRLALGVPDGVLEAAGNSVLPAELGLTHLNAISFTKGCYVGQEVTTRLYRRGTPKKALYQLSLPVSAPTGTPVQLATGLTVGWLGSANQQSALAVLQTRHATSALFINDQPLADVKRSPIYNQQVSC